MLRTIFVFIIIIVGAFYAAQGAFYALLFYLWNAYFRPEEWTYGGFIQSLRLSLIIGIYLVIRTVVSLPKLKINARTGLILLFLVQSIVATIYSEHPDWSASFLADFAKVLLISYLIVVLVDDRGKFRVTLLVIALSLGFECAKQGWANLYRAPGAKNDNPIAFLGDNNGVALGTMMLVPILGALAQTASSRWEKYAHRFLAVGVFMRGFTTYSRGGFLAAGVLGLFTFMRSEKKLRALVGVLAVAGLVWSVMPRSFWDRMNTITASDEERDESAAGRLHFWDVAVTMADAKPFTGVGLNGFEPSYDAYNVSREFGGVRATHSTWFGVLADLGYTGLVLLVANFLLALWSCWRVYRAARRNPAQRDLYIYANALITSLAAFGVAGTFLASQYTEMLWHFMALATALYLVSASEQQRRGSAVAVATGVHA